VLAFLVVGTAQWWPDLTLVARSRRVAASTGERWPLPPAILVAISALWWPDLESAIGSRRVEPGSGVGGCLSPPLSVLAVSAVRRPDLEPTPDLWHSDLERVRLFPPPPTPPLADGCLVVDGASGIPAGIRLRICAMSIGWVDGRQALGVSLAGDGGWLAAVVPCGSLPVIKSSFSSVR
jgi:hypothetical protein